MRAFERLLGRYLRWRGWIVFWLDDANECHTLCWLQLYRNERKAGRL